MSASMGVGQHWGLTAVTLGARTSGVSVPGNLEEAPSHFLLTRFCLGATPGTPEADYVNPGIEPE